MSDARPRDIAQSYWKANLDRAPDFSRGVSRNEQCKHSVRSRIPLTVNSSATSTESSTFFAPREMPAERVRDHDQAMHETDSDFLELTISAIVEQGGDLLHTRHYREQGFVKSLIRLFSFRKNPAVECR